MRLERRTTKTLKSAAAHLVQPRRLLLEDQLQDLRGSASTATNFVSKDQREDEELEDEEETEEDAVSTILTAVMEAVTRQPSGHYLPKHWLAPAPKLSSIPSRFLPP